MKIGDKLRGVITGLIHISEIKTGYIDNIYNTLKVGFGNLQTL